MAASVNYEAVVLDLRGVLGDRTSWGTPQLRALLDELEQRHRTSTPATRVPLTSSDPRGDARRDGRRR